MKLPNTVRNKVWLCVNIAFIGFIAATGFALYSNHHLKTHLVDIRDLDFNLALQSTELLNHFNTQNSYYEESFLFGLPESAQKANALIPEVLRLFSSINAIARNRHQTEPEISQRLLNLEQSYQTYAEQATQLYPVLSRGEDPAAYAVTMQELAAAQKTIRADLEATEIFYRDVFGGNVTTLIDLAVSNNELLSGFFVALLAFMTVAVNLTANQALIKPLTQIKTAVANFGKGQRAFPELSAMNPKDEIGELGVALVKMADDLEATTVSKAYVDSILGNMSDSLIVTSSDFRIRSVNHATIALLGYRSVELTGQHIGKILRDFPEESTLTDGECYDFTAHLSYNEEKSYLARDGREIPVLLSTSHLRTADNPIQGLVFVAKDITERKLAEAKLEQLAQFDFLTGLPNRHSFNERLQQTLSRGEREKRNVGLMFLDLDRFKSINDSLGHSYGDALLKTLATRLSGCIRESDTVARLGGDEFAVILDNLHQHQDAIQTSNRILTAFSKPVTHEGVDILTSASIGIAIFPADAGNTEELLKNADIAMYQAKQSGGNNFRFFVDEFDPPASETPEFG